MRLGLWVLLALLVGAFIAHFVLQDRGYVLINFRGYVLEMSVPGLILLLVAAYAAVRGAAALWRAPRRLGAAFAESRLRRAGGHLTSGLIHIAEGDWARAERLLTRGLKNVDAPLANYLLAARAAQLQGAPERRDEWLARARAEGAQAEAAVLLTKAELQLGSGELERALETVHEIQAVRADHPVAIGLLARIHHARGDRAALAELLPRLAHARLPRDLLATIVADGLAERLARSAPTKEELAQAWACVPGELRPLPSLVALRARALHRLGRGDDAEKELRTALKRDWHPALVAAYGDVRAADPQKQLRQAETWLKDHPEDGLLLLTAARLCMQSELWGKARSYLESSLALAPDPVSYALYGRLLLQLGEQERAATAFQSGLSLAAGVEADAPLPARLPALAAAPSEKPEPSV